MGIEGAFSCSLVQHGRAGSLFASIGWSYRVRCHRDQGLRPDSPGVRPGRRSLGPCGRLSQVGNRHRNAPSVRSNPWPPCRKVEERGGRAESRYRGRRLTITPHDINSIENPSSRTDPTFAGGRSCNAAVDAGEAKTPVRRGPPTGLVDTKRDRRARPPIPSFGCQDRAGITWRSKSSIPEMS